MYSTIASMPAANPFGCPLACVCRLCARAAPTSTSHQRRAVGRARLPSTVHGLLFHVAEHTQRHTGQVVTTAKIVRGLGLATTITDDAVRRSRILDEWAGVLDERLDMNRPSRRNGR